MSRTTKVILAVTLVLVFAAGAVVGMVRQRVVIGTHPPAPRGSFLTKELNLTPDQQEQMRRIWSDLGPASGRDREYWDKRREFQRQRDDAILPHAITILSRFALGGIQRTPIANELAAALPALPFEVLAASVIDMALLMPFSLPLQVALDEAIDAWRGRTHINILDLIAPLIEYAPQQARRYEHHLRAVMRAPSAFARQAAALLLRLLPGDTEARQYLQGQAR